MLYHIKPLKNSSIFGWQLNTTPGRCNINNVDSRFIVVTLYYQIDWTQSYRIWSVVNVFDVNIQYHISIEILLFWLFGLNYGGSEGNFGNWFVMILAWHDEQSGDGLWVNIYKSQVWPCGGPLNPWNFVFNTLMQVYSEWWTGNGTWKMQVCDSILHSEQIMLILTQSQLPDSATHLGTLIWPISQQWLATE